MYVSKDLLSKRFMDINLFIYNLLGSAERYIEILGKLKLTLFPSRGVVLSSVLKPILIPKV